MNHSLICVHCGTTVALEPRTDRGGTGLLAHLFSLHRELVAAGATPRWAELLEHFRIVPG
jgi:hypothetical protein